MERRRLLRLAAAAAAAVQVGCAARSPGSLFTLGRPGHRVVAEAGMTIGSAGGLETWFYVYELPDRRDGVDAWLDSGGERGEQIGCELRASTQWFDPDGDGPLPPESRGVDTITLRVGPSPGSRYAIVDFTQSRG